MHSFWNREASGEFMISCVWHLQRVSGEAPVRAGARARAARRRAQPDPELQAIERSYADIEALDRKIAKITELLPEPPQRPLLEQIRRFEERREKIRARFKISLPWPIQQLTTAPVCASVIGHGCTRLVVRREVMERDNEGTQGSRRGETAEISVPRDVAADGQRLGHSLLDVLMPATPPEPRNARVIRLFDHEAGEGDASPFVRPTTNAQQQKRDAVRAARNKSLFAAAGFARAEAKSGE
jgi:hypothetical protein